MAYEELYGVLANHRASIIAKTVEMLSGDAEMRLLATMQGLGANDHVAGLADIWLEALMTDLKLEMDAAFKEVLTRSLQFAQGHSLPFAPPLYHKLFEAMLVGVRACAGGGGIPEVVDGWADQVRRILEETIGIG